MKRIAPTMKLLIPLVVAAMLSFGAVEAAAQTETAPTTMDLETSTAPTETSLEEPVTTTASTTTYYEETPDSAPSTTTYYEDDYETPMDDAAPAACAGCLAVGVAFPLVLLVISIGIALWIYRDAKERGVQAPALWAILGFIFNVLGLVIYLIARKNMSQPGGGTPPAGPPPPPPA